MQTLNIIIPERMTGNRIDSSLSEMLPDYSRSKITAWIKSGDALIKQKSFKPKDKVIGNEVGFHVEVLDGPPGKRQMTKANKI